MTLPSKVLDQITLKEHLHYEPDTGVFTRKRAPQKMHIGSVAGWVDAKNGHRKVRINRTTYYAHRLAFLYMTGAMPNGFVDHQNGIRDDNRWTNLAVCADFYISNARNQQTPKHNTSGCMGVKWKKGHCRWEVYIGGKDRTYIGSSKDWFEAVCMRKSAENRFGYHPNHGRAAA